MRGGLAAPCSSRALRMNQPLNEGLNHTNGNNECVNASNNASDSSVFVFILHGDPMPSHSYNHLLLLRSHFVFFVCLSSARASFYKAKVRFSVLPTNTHTHTNECVCIYVLIKWTIYMYLYDSRHHHTQHAYKSISPKTGGLRILCI